MDDGPQHGATQYLPRDNRGSGRHGAMVLRSLYCGTKKSPPKPTSDSPRGHKQKEWIGRYELDGPRRVDGTGLLAHLKNLHSRRAERSCIRLAATGTCTGTTNLSLTPSSSLPISDGLHGQHVVNYLVLRERLAEDAQVLAEVLERNQPRFGLLPPSMLYVAIFQ